jgi:AraC-like DNA-binding protein
MNPSPRATVRRFDNQGVRLEMAARPRPDALRPWVQKCAGYVETATGPLARTELPGPSVVVIIELGPPLRLHDPVDSSRAVCFAGGFAAGLDERPTLTTHDGFQAGVQVNLSPVAARRFFDLPMSELTGRTVSLRDLLPREHATLAERLAELADWDARLDVVEALLARRIAASPARTDVVTWACDRIERAPAVELKTLARELGYSQKHVIDLFRQHVGMPPKQFSRIVRFDRLVQHLRGGGRGSWAELAARFGWYDQAHLSSDVKRITGVPPSRARALLLGLSDAR